MSQKFQFSQIPYHQQPLSCIAHLTWLLRLNHECYSNVDSLLPIFSSFLSRVQKLKPCPQRGPQLVFAAQSTYFPPILTQFPVENKQEIFYPGQVLKEFPHSTPPALITEK